MSATLLLAAGGGGDVTGAAMLRDALDDELPGPVYYASCSWDRIAVDPLPGPRAPTDFVGFERVAQLNFAVSEATASRPPTVSLLPSIAAQLGTRIFLLDAQCGTAGLHRQLSELTRVLDVTRVVVCDVGGDIIARGDEVTLASPLGDFMMLAATAFLDVEVTVAVGGLGLDGELTADKIREHHQVCGDDRPWVRLARLPLQRFGRFFEWHPSDCLRILREYEDRVAEEGVSFLTIRRVGEILELPVEGLAELRRSLSKMSHPQYVAPVWVIGRRSRG